jgi:hypothetical protein
VTAQMHAMNEYLPQDYLIKAVKTMALAIHEWCA